MEQFPSFDEALQRLSDEAARLTRFELHALSGASRADAARFAAAWGQIPVEHRRYIAREFVESAEHNFEMDFYALFRVMLDDQDEAVRLDAIEGLWECDDATLVQPLVHLLRHDPAAAVRAGAAIALSRFALQAELGELDERRAQMVVNALLDTIHRADEDADVRRRAIEALAYVEIDSVRDIIDAAYNDGDERMRASAVFAMGRTCDPFWASTVLSELNASEPEMRFEAARAAGELKLRKAVPTLIKLLEDPDREVQEAAIWALGQVGGRQAKRALEKCLQSSDELVSEYAEEALRELALGDVPLLLFSYESKEEMEDTLDDDAWDEELDEDDLAELRDEDGEDEEWAADLEDDEDDDWSLN